jgi:hypothetical protein
MNSHRAAALLVLCAAACGGGVPLHDVLLPPQMDLVPYGHIGLVTFTTENAKGKLAELATGKFEEYVLGAQHGIEVLELGAPERLLQRAGATVLGAAAAQALATDSNPVPVVFFGHLKVSNVKPSGGLLGVVHLEGTVTVELDVALLSTKTGGTLWRSSATRSEKVGGLSIEGGIPYFSAEDPNDAYGHLINSLVYDVTYDFRSTWVKR